jgi:hypothetical protein
MRPSSWRRDRRRDRVATASRPDDRGRTPQLRLVSTPACIDDVVRMLVGAVLRMQLSARSKRPLRCGESMPDWRVAGFALIRVALALITGDGLRASRATPAAPPVETEPVPLEG